MREPEAAHRGASARRRQRVGDVAEDVELWRHWASQRYEAFTTSDAEELASQTWQAFGREADFVTARTIGAFLGADEDGLKRRRQIWRIWWARVCIRCSRRCWSCIEPRESRRGVIPSPSIDVAAPGIHARAGTRAIQQVGVVNEEPRAA